MTKLRVKIRVPESLFQNLNKSAFLAMMLGDTIRLIESTQSLFDEIPGVLEIGFMSAVIAIPFKLLLIKVTRGSVGMIRARHGVTLIVTKARGVI